MSNSDESQDLTQSPKNNSFRDESWGILGFTFGLARKPTRPEFISITKYIAILLAGCALPQWQTFRELLSPQLSKYVEYIGLSLVALTGFLLYKTLEKNDLLKAKYEHHCSDHTPPD